ncbi:MAG: hypothetical protein J3R72DRAFT_425619 [Linnemannia gamsii]|nr:MAG: hypothetical protein J3R72DRAFT_425619 [Linnemannia gamsii]
MSSNLSALYGTTPPPAAGGVANSSSGNGRSRASTVSMLSSNMSFIPCASGQEMAEVETRRRPISAIILPSQQPIPVGTGTVTPPAAADTGILYPTCLSTAAFPESHQRSYSSGQASNTTSHSRYSYGYTPSQHQQDSLSIHEFYLPVKAPSVLNSPQLHAIASLPAPRSLGTPTSSSFITSSEAPSSSSLPVLPFGSAAASVSEESSDHHQHSHPVHHQHQRQEAEQALDVNDGDEECAICLSDFEDGDELRHLNCVDRWLVKSAFCPKCLACTKTHSKNMYDSISTWQKT